MHCNFINTKNCIFILQLKLKIYLIYILIYKKIFDFKFNKIIKKNIENIVLASIK